MGNLLFSPNGRISPAQFTKGALILIFLYFILSIAPLASPGLGMIAMIAQILLLWCWIVLWIKRYHDSGSSGWMSLIPIAIFVVGYFLVSNYITNKYMPAEIKADIDAIREDGDIMGMMEVMAESAPEIAATTTMPSAIGFSILSAIIAFGFNALIKHQPEENQFGHPS